MKRKVSIVVVFALLFSIVPNTAFAGAVKASSNMKSELQTIQDGSSEYNSLMNDDIEIDIENDHTIRLETEDVSGTISIAEENGRVVTSIIDEETGEEFYFVRDDVNGTMYSSITGNTVQLEDISASFTPEEKDYRPTGIARY